MMGADFMPIPVARFTVAMLAASVILPPVIAADGAAVYRQTCAACHDAGVAGAPRPGDPGAWEQRLPKGIDAMTGLVIEGVQGYSGVMPPRGGNPALSDAELRAAVEFIVAKLPWLRCGRRTASRRRP
jgi:cytochrome c5